MAGSICPLNKIMNFVTINSDSEITIRQIMHYLKLLNKYETLDKQKAFDTVNHEIFLSKLKHYRIKGTSYNWFNLFLCERMQYTLIKERKRL